MAGAPGAQLPPDSDRSKFQMEASCEAMLKRLGEPPSVSKRALQLSRGASDLQGAARVYDVIYDDSVRGSCDAVVRHQERG
jgi:hypothetical protein